MRLWLSALWIVPALLSAGCASPALTSRSSAESQAWLAASGLASGRATRHVKTTRSGVSVALTGEQAVTSGSRSGQPSVTTPTSFTQASKQSIARQVSHRSDNLPPYPHSTLRSATTPKVGSPEWEREQAEIEKRE